jgi:conjugal transfer mating pair stabilization protein TraN
MTRFLVLLLFICAAPLTRDALAFEEEKCIPITEKPVCIDERIEEDFGTTHCWNEKMQYRCSSKEENNCASLEENRGCNELKGECVTSSATGLCSHYSKVFVCGNKQVDENTETKIISSEFKTLKDEKDLEACDGEIKNKYCELAEETCIEKGETRNINGKDVYKDCWKWDRKYNCRTDTKVSECDALKEKDCIEKGRECIHTEDGRCEHYVVKYECENTKTEKLDCIASNFCIGDVCEEQQRNINTNFGLAVSQLGVLAQVQKDGESCGCDKTKDPDCKLHKIEGEKCKLFKGEKYICSRKTGAYNCCSQKGLLKEVFGCSAKEKELALKRQGKLCHAVGSWRGKGIKRFITKRSFCCFNSSLARIIQEQGRAQLGLGWWDEGKSKKEPNCRALTLSEIQRIDFSKIDFSEMYEALQNRAQADFGKAAKDIESKLKGYQSNTGDASNLMKEKMQRFYENN